MSKYRIIWDYEQKKANKIARRLLETERIRTSGWRKLLMPVFLPQYIRYRRKLSVTRKNLLFTKKLALEAAKNLQLGKERAQEIRQIEIKTREILNRQTKGLYTEKVRQKQLAEIEFLINYYLDLLDSNQKNYASMLKSKFPSKGKYLSFLDTLQKIEHAVIQASIETVRRGTKKERRIWFENLINAIKEVRRAEVDDIFANR
ncbi:MAG: NF038143 family protein [Deltaproteobacteria bacterium]|nr:MAG: NF038143 family protein [Deltaproteobacteria bacterium]